MIKFQDFLLLEFKEAAKLIANISSTQTKEVIALIKKNGTNITAVDGRVYFIKALLSVSDDIIIELLKRAASITQSATFAEGKYFHDRGIEIRLVTDTTGR